MTSSKMIYHGYTIELKYYIIYTMFSVQKNTNLYFNIKVHYKYEQ